MSERVENVKERPTVTLFQGQAGSSRLGLVQYRGGDLAIVCNDEIIGRRRWSPGDVEACIEAFLRLAHECPDIASY